MNADLNVFKMRCETGVSEVVSLSCACLSPPISVNDSIHIRSVTMADPLIHQHGVTVLLVCPGWPPDVSVC